ncbi:MAG: thioesterase [Bacteroidetes bacterium SW_10_40_5]|nr:MAG: thioesterase [Bacteroidetes bacterium SW_10_40_5]
MYVHQIQLRVRYSETDRMGYAYYGNYAQYYEIGRVEAFRNLDFSYKELEDSGVILPVLNMQCQYFKPAIYDDLLTVKTVIPEMPGVRIKFNYEIYCSTELLNKGYTELIFFDTIKQKPCRMPKWMQEKLKVYF